MSETPQLQLALRELGKAAAAIDLVEASLATTPPYDPAVNYTPKQREPFDALSDRFVRAVEVSVRFLRSYERVMFAENSDTYRDLLQRMEKLALASSTILWVDMREVRNRIVHDYLPEDLKVLYDELMGRFGDELKRLGGRLPALRSDLEALVQQAADDPS